MMNGLSTINIELTSRCEKSCWMCGRRKIERDHPEKADWGDMSWELLEKIARQLPPGIVVQLHNNGEPLLYPWLGQAVRLFDQQITGFDTNGKLLMEKADQIIDNLDTLSISIVQDDPDAEDQFAVVKKFLMIKGASKPLVVFRCLGNVDTRRYESMGTVATRILHDPMGSRDYERRVTVPEIGVCLDLLHHLAIDRYGNVSLCVRFDPYKFGVIGDANTEKLADIWDGVSRRAVIGLHLKSKRGKVPLCRTCDYWGIPTSR